mmetsp:Transcript_17480/g.24298  ORF Transcript_17480/g.24298 Transcript_17480/m.24298 type:complete len:204 (+) Transcript_17480:1470-2081(+)
MVHTHRHFKTIISPGRFGVLGLVYSSVTNKMIKRSGGLESLKVSNEISDRLETGKFKLHDGVGSFGHLHLLGNSLSLICITTSHDHIVVASLCKGGSAVKSKTGRGSGDDDKLTKTNFDSTKNLGTLLFEVKFLRKLSLCKHILSLSCCRWCIHDNVLEESGLRGHRLNRLIQRRSKGSGHWQQGHGSRKEANHIGLLLVVVE